ncbi:MAG: hypothetical protein Q9165_004265 [Trypethelium subeluteriae]
MAEQKSSGFDFNAIDDDEEFFDGVKKEPLSPSPSRPQSSPPTCSRQSTTPSPIEYKPETKPGLKTYTRSKRESFFIPKMLLNMFDAPPGCTNQDYMARLGKVSRARVNRMGIVSKRIRQFRAQSEYENACEKELKALEDRVRAEGQEQDMKDGRHFTLVAKRLGLVLKKAEEIQRTPTLGSVDGDNESSVPSSADYYSDRNAGDSLKQMRIAAGFWPSKEGSGVPRGSAGASHPVHISVGPAREKQADTVTPKVDPETVDERPRKIVKSAWSGEWESLEFSFDVLYRKARERYQGLDEDEENHGEGSMADAFAKSESVLNGLLRETETKAEESEEKEKHESDQPGGKAEKKAIMKQESGMGTREAMTEKESAEEESREREARVKRESELED